MKTDKMIVCINREKGKITYNSGPIYTTEDLSDLEQYFDEVYRINYQNPKPPKERGKGTYCPYCGKWTRFTMIEDCYRGCPVCLISDNEFYTKKFNQGGNV